jgi:pilus assembly protein Flp/PilA
MCRRLIVTKRTLQSKRKGDPIMQALLHRVRSFLKSEDGPTATEYAVMLALIIVVALGAISALGTKVSTTFSNVTTALPTG